MARRNGEAVQEGTLILARGLQPSSKGSRVRFSGHARTVLDGPFAETKELIAGFWHEIEIRPVFGAEDLGEVLTPELRAQEERLRARATELKLAATRS